MFDTDSEVQFRLTSLAKHGLHFGWQAVAIEEKDVAIEERDTAVKSLAAFKRKIMASFCLDDTPQQPSSAIQRSVLPIGLAAGSS